MIIICHHRSCLLNETGCTYRSLFNIYSSSTVFIERVKATCIECIGKIPLVHKLYLMIVWYNNCSWLLCMCMPLYCTAWHQCSATQSRLIWVFWHPIFIINTFPSIKLYRFKYTTISHSNLWHSQGWFNICTVIGMEINLTGFQHEKSVKLQII